jgi:uncharacterized membrane protein YbhN (UPF0104 family)
VVDHQRSGRRWLRPAAVLLVVAGVAAAAVSAPSTVATALRTLTRLHPGWLAAAIAVEAVSVLGKGQVQRVLVGASGARRPRMGDYLAVTYVGAAVSGSLPGGPALAAAYTYRQLRSRGATEGQAMWTLVASGALMTALIAMVSTTLITFAGRPTAATLVTGAVEVAAAGALAVLARWAARHPDRVTGAVAAALGWLNRLRRRPVDTGRDRVVATVATLTGIQPRRRHWTAALTWAAASWSGDVACLTLCLLAIGTPVPSLAVIVAAYVAGVAATQAAPTPSGLGVTEAAITAVLITHGSPAQSALAAVLLFRLLNPGLNTAVGATIGLLRPLTNRLRPKPPTQLPPVTRPRELAAVAA